MPDQATLRKAILDKRPDLKGRLWLNKVRSGGRSGFYSVTVRGVMTLLWVDVDEPLEDALWGFFSELGEYDNAAHP